MAVTDVRDIITSFNELEYRDVVLKKSFKKVPDKYKDVYQLLTKKSMDINEISRKLRKPMNEINSLMFMMELEEFAVRKADGTYSLMEN